MLNRDSDMLNGDSDMLNGDSDMLNWDSDMSNWDLHMLNWDSDMLNWDSPYHASFNSKNIGIKNANHKCETIDARIPHYNCHTLKILLLLQTPIVRSIGIES